MTNGDETREMLDRVQEQRVAAVVRQQEQDEAREMWPVRVNEALRVLGAKVEELESRLAAVEPIRG